MHHCLVVVKLYTPVVNLFDILFCFAVCDVAQLVLMLSVG